MQNIFRIIIVLILGVLLASCGSSRKSTKKNTSSSKTQTSSQQTSKTASTKTKTSSSITRSVPPAPEYYPSNTWNNDHVRYKKTQAIPGTYKLLLVDNAKNDFAIPVKGRILSEFGMRSGRPHTGIDIKLNAGDPVYCAFAGVVRMAKLYSSYGNIVVVRHYNGLETAYSHLSSISVKVNQKVEAGDLLGKGGRTGRATTDHLHFEVRFMCEPFNPREIIDFTNWQLHSNYCTLTPSIFTDPFAGAGNSTAVTVPAKSSNSDKSTASSSYATHVVEKGNTLYNISKLYKTTVAELCKLNGINENAVLKIGQKLKVPVVK